jgi:hypothetical protein
MLRFKEWLEFVCSTTFVKDITRAFWAKILVNTVFVEISSAEAR